MKQIHLHLISDSTGETVHGLARACIVQFEDVEAMEHNWPLVRTTAQIDRLLAAIGQNPGIVLFTLVNAELRQRLQQGCRELGLPCISVLDPFISAFAGYIGSRSKGVIGRQHTLDSSYFERIDAMQYALAHDDGQGLWNLKEADVVITGVSRTSKTPTCMYLANRGIKAANVPFVPSVGLPAELINLPEGRPLVVGLTKDPAQLVQIRRNRLRMIAEDDETDYVDLEVVKAEVAQCRRICTERRWPMIDVSRRSIEETAAAIIKQLEQRQEKLAAVNPDTNPESA